MTPQPPSRSSGSDGHVHDFRGDRCTYPGCYERLSPDHMLRGLHRRFRHVLLRREGATYIIEARRAMRGDSRDYAPRAWAPTAGEAIRHLWERT